MARGSKCKYTAGAKCHEAKIEQNVIGAVPSPDSYRGSARSVVRAVAIDIIILVLIS